MTAKMTRLEFPGSHGVPLAGRLELPAGTPRAFALFAHCFTCGKDVFAATRIARALAERDIAVLRFDFTGLGQSGGDFANTDFSSNVDDLVYAADHLRETYAAPTILIGHSLGGAAVIAAAHRIPETRAVATIGAPADPEHVTQHLGDSQDDIEDHGAADVELAGRTFRIRRQFLSDIAAQPQTERIETLDAALLVMHSPVDKTVGVDNARRIFDAAKHPKSFVSLDDADHLLSAPGDATYAATVLAAWASRYALATADESAHPEHLEGQVVVSESDAEPYGQHVRVRNHALTADEPEPMGSDTGPTPYDLLLAALGSCTSMTVRMYADRKKWALENVTVALRHARIHATDCANCETENGMVDRIERVIQFDGELDESQRERLLEIADKCPVHRTLNSEVSIESSELRPDNAHTRATE